MGDSYGAEPSVSGANQGALEQPTPRLAIKHCQRPLWLISGHTDKSAPCPIYPQ